MRIKKVTIIGLGVIGGSLGLALQEKYPEIKVTGIDIKNDIIQEALNKKVINEGTVRVEEGVREADLVVLALPFKAMEKIAKQILPYLKEGAIITDVGSIKEDIVKMMEKLIPPHLSFIGGHPMAGSEKCGLEGAHELLFENAAYILTPTKTTSTLAIETVKDLVEGLGAKTIFLTPEDHDRKVAAVSHLPHVAASSLVETIGVLEEKEGGYFLLAAGGFRDTTRIAASNSEMWRDILLQNKEFLLPLLDNYIHSLTDFKEYLEDDNSTGLFNLLRKSRHLRESVPTGLKGLLPHPYELSVMVADKPGAIGDLTTLLGRERINISDIEIQRVRDEKDGTLRLSFSKEEVQDKAMKIMVNKGYKVRKIRV